MTKINAEVPAGQVSEESLSGKEKILTWVLCIFNPLIAGTIFYYGLKKRLPKKQSGASNISLRAFLVAIVVVIAFFH